MHKVHKMLGLARGNFCFTCCDIGLVCQYMYLSFGQSFCNCSFWGWKLIFPQLPTNTQLGFVPTGYFVLHTLFLFVIYLLKNPYYFYRGKFKWCSIPQYLCELDTCSEVFSVGSSIGLSRSVLVPLFSFSWLYPSGNLAQKLFGPFYGRYLLSIQRWFFVAVQKIWRHFFIPFQKTSDLWNNT